MENYENYLIVGLGNPGEKYKFNRHNIGWMIAEQFAEKFNGKWQKERKYFYSFLDKFNKNIHLCLPRTYMNLSGEAVLSLCTKFKIHPKNVIVIVDEYNFPTGKIHFRTSGSDGGHNGLTSIIEMLGTQEFGRLRCGIDRKFGPGELVDYVLADFPNSEYEALEQMKKNSIEGLLYLLENGVAKGMQFINTNFNPKKEEKAQEETSPKPEII